MGVLQVDTNGLAELVAVCAQAVASPAPDAAMPLVHSTFRATSAAVHAAHADVVVTLERISDRLRRTGDKVASIEATYYVNDEYAAMRLDPAGPAVFDV